MASNVSLLLWLLVYPTLGLELQPAETAAANNPDCEELTTSLAVNQLAILQLMRDGSHASSGMAEREARRNEEAAARDARLQETEKLLEDLRAMVENATQETLNGVSAQHAALRQEMTRKVTSLQAEMTSGVTSLREEMATQGRLLEEVHKYTTCPDGWVRHESSCYLVDGTKRSWEDSFAYCRSLGGDLAKITSAEEQEFIKAHSNGRYGYWIGLNDRATEGHLVWTDGLRATYTVWHQGQPDGGRDQNCVGMWREDDYKWWDYGCSNTESVVCERPVHA